MGCEGLGFEGLGFDGVGQALGLTLRLSVVTTLVLLALALPLAWWIAQGLGRGRGLGRVVVQALVALPLVLPPTVIGFYLLVGLGPVSGPGRVLSGLLGHPLAFSFAGLLVGSVVFSLPFAVQPLVAGFSAIPRGTLEAAAGLGRGPWYVFSRVALPLARGSLLTSAVLTLTHTVGEFGVVLMVGGNMPGVTRTLSIALYDLVEGGDYAGAGRLSLGLLGFSFVALALVYGTAGLRARRGFDVG